MSWYLTIRSDAEYSEAVEPHALMLFLQAIPELKQTGTNSFREAPGQPWVSVTLAMSDNGSFADDDQPLSSVNLVDVVCSYEHDEGWYDGLASRIAGFLQWEALDEHAARVVWPVREAG